VITEERMKLLEPLITSAIQALEGRYRRPINWLVGTSDDGEPLEVWALGGPGFGIEGMADVRKRDDGSVLIGGFGKRAHRALKALEAARQAFFDFQNSTGGEA
jgi:hypothetical protein